MRVSSNGTNVNHPPYTFFTSSFSYPPRPVFLQRLHLLVASHQQARQRDDGRSSFKSFTQFWDGGRRGDVYRGGGEDLGSQSRQFGMDYVGKRINGLKRQIKHVEGFGGRTRLWVTRYNLDSVTGIGNQGFGNIRSYRPIVCSRELLAFLPFFAFFPFPFFLFSWSLLFSFFFY